MPKQNAQRNEFLEVQKLASIFESSSSEKVRFVIIFFPKENVLIAAIDPAPILKEN